MDEATQEKIDELKKKLIANKVIVGVAVGVILLLVLLTRSCGSAPVATVQDKPATKSGEQKPKFDGSTDLTKEKSKGRNLDSFVGFKFGTKADKFKDVFENVVTSQDVFSGAVSTNGINYKCSVEKVGFRLFKTAHLTFTSKDKRLYKVVLQTAAEDVAKLKPTEILRETQMCAVLIERKYGERFNIMRKDAMFSEKRREKVGLRDVTHCGGVAEVIGSEAYAVVYNDSQYAIAPAASYHGFFNNTIEVEVSFNQIVEKKTPSYLGITISAMDHGVIEEEGGHTECIKFDAADDANVL